ncbi:MAG: recombinase family protein [Nakamurella sp.]
MTETRAGIYARISSDDTGEGLGVARQIADCEAEARRRGWTVTARFTDNDVSATRSKRRPEYERMLTAAAAGRITGLIVWDVDRLTRTPRELEDVIDLADRVGLALASVGGEIDLSTPQGRMTARIKGSVARHETEQMSRRIRRKFDDRAQAGSPHGFVAYGYRRVDGRDVLEPGEAAVIGSTADRLLGGESLRSIVADLNAQAVPSPRGLPWSSTALRQVMTRERNAGMRRHRGQVIGRGDWPAIYSPDVHDRVVALLTDPTRRTNRGASRRHLLSGIARCGREGCDGTMVVNGGRVTATRSGTKRQPPAYVCPRCTKIRRKQTAVDEYVEAVMIGRLSQPDALAALSAGDPAETERARQIIATLQARLELAADEYADGNLTGAQLKRITAKLAPQIERERAVMSASVGMPGLADLAGTDAENRWRAAPIDVQRTVIETLAEVTILPTGPGRPFDPALISIEWKS